jgi:hypothetical protein
LKPEARATITPDTEPSTLVAPFTPQHHGMVPGLQADTRRIITGNGIPMRRPSGRRRSIDTATFTACGCSGGGEHLLEAKVVDEREQQQGRMERLSQPSDVPGAIARVRNEPTPLKRRIEKRIVVMA